MGGILAGYREQGYRAFKIGWGPFRRRGSHSYDEAIIRAAREALSEQDELMVDAGGSDAFWPNGLKWALRTADMLSAWDVRWFEEALRPDDIGAFVELRRQSRVPISGGEVLTRRQSFVPFLEAGAFDVVQPDVTKVGGISEQRRIAELADQHGVACVGHGWNTALGLAADLQLAAGLPHVDYVEYIVGSPYVDGILTDPFALDADGNLAIPQKPGLGVTIDASKLGAVAQGIERLRL
jgi:L-alanine-DL-glutamate epimerase-like enolase superfamily enzyme